MTEQYQQQATMKLKLSFSYGMTGIDANKLAFIDKKSYIHTLTTLTKRTIHTARKENTFITAIDANRLVSVNTKSYIHTHYTDKTIIASKLEIMKDGVV